MSSSFMLFTIIIFTLNQICICKSADISDIRRLRIRAALSDPIEESCKGSLDYNGFSKLDKICKDCFNLIREPEIYQLCRYVDIGFVFSFCLFYLFISFFVFNLLIFILERIVFVTNSFLSVHEMLKDY